MMTDLEKALAPKAPKQAKSSKLWVGFTIDGTGAKELQSELTKYGIHDRAEYIKSLVRADLARRRQKPKGKAEAEEPAAVTA